MKFRLLQCFMFAFACVMGTCSVSCWADCDTGQYSDNGECKDCPLKGRIGNAFNSPFAHGDSFDYTRYSFGASGEGKNSCTVKLDPEKSNCDTGTNVVYKWNGDETTGKYILDSGNYTVVPDNGYSQLYESDNTAVANFSGKDHCDKCPDGKYMNNANPKTCVACPNPATTNCGQSESEEDTNCRNSVNNRFGFTTRYNGDDGITGCAVKLDATKDSCDSVTNVVYAYSSAKNNYVRIASDVFPTTKSIVADPLPSVDDMESSFCQVCPSNKAYNVGGECGTCWKAGYYLEELPSGLLPIQCRYSNSNCPKEYMCVKCPAGSYCPEGTTYKSYCPANTYSEDGSGECNHCPVGYSTASSGPVEAGFDGLCLGRDKDGENGFGVDCVSPDACKLTVASLSMNRSNGWQVLYLGDNVKIESLNKSVVKIIQDINHATMATGRPSGSPFDDFDDEE